MGEIGRRLRFVLFPVNINRCMRLFDGLNAGYRQAPVFIRRMAVLPCGRSTVYAVA